MARRKEEEVVVGPRRINRLFGDTNVNVVGWTDLVINILVEHVRFMLSQ